MVETPRFMELVLYTAANSRGFLVEWLLEELQAPYRCELLDLAAGDHKQESYLAVHPLGVVPALLVDGRPMMESLAISLFLADAFPAAGLAPDVASPDRGLYYQWMVYATATVEPRLSAAFIRGLGQSSADRLSVATAEERWAFATVLAPVERGMARGHLLESGLSAADIVLASELYWASQVGLLADAAEAQRYLSTLMKRPACPRVEPTPA
jgi:glutathione S-transferase